MKLRNILISMALLTAPVVSATLVMPSNTNIVHIDAAASTGLNGGVYVFEQANGVELVCRHAAGTNVGWQRFGSNGAAYSVDVTPSYSSSTESRIMLDASDSGYVLTENGSNTYFWVVNYANHQLHLTGIDFATDQDCDRTTLLLQGQGDRILFYTINGRSEELSRELEIEYNTLEYNADSHAYTMASASSTAAYIHQISVEAPLCDTQFRVSGDRFTQAWGYTQQVESEMWQTRAVAAETTATQAERDVANEQKESDSGLGGSAPCDILFDAAVSDAAVYYQWQMSRSAEFDDIDLSFNDLQVDYTFREQGTTYVRFIANNAAGDCEYISSTYEVFIGESALRCPNAFSPQTSPGVNDEWRVSYKSLISFECHIFNKWGTELFNTTDPATGWDGKYGGKYVPSGTYYYVIRATGSDGKEYKLAGDINIIGMKSSSGSSTNSETTTDE